MIVCGPLPLTWLSLTAIKPVLLCCPVQCTWLLWWFRNVSYYNNIPKFAMAATHHYLLWGRNWLLSVWRSQLRVSIQWIVTKPPKENVIKGIADASLFDPWLSNLPETNWISNSIIHTVCFLDVVLNSHKPFCRTRNLNRCKSFLSPFYSFRLIHLISIDPISGRSSKLELGSILSGQISLLFDCSFSLA